MNKNSLSLYQLIDSLSSSEKRYFQLYAKRHQINGINNYLVLYNKIVDEKIKSDAEFELKVQDSKFKKYIPVAKFQLFQSILQSLDLFDRRTSILEQIKILLHQAQILLDKVIINEAEKLVAKAKKRIIKYELFSLMPELIVLKEKIITYKNFKNYTLKELEEFHLEKKHYSVLLNNYYDFWNLLAKIRMFHFFETKTNNEKKLKQLKIWFNDKLLVNKETLTISSELLFYRIKALESFILSDIKNSFKFNRLGIQVLDDNLNIREIEIQLYIKMLINYIADCFSLNKKIELKKAIVKIKNIPLKNKSKIEVYLFKFINQIELNLNLSNGEYLKNFKLISTLEKEIHKFKNKLTVLTKSTFYYLFMYSSFGANEFETTIYWADGIINLSKKNISLELQLSARLVLLFAHYELGNYKLLEYLINNTRRYYKRNEKFYKLEYLTLTCLYNLIKIHKINKKTIYLKYKEDLIILEKENKKLNIFKYFDFANWVNAHINKITFCEMHLLNLKNSKFNNHIT